MARAKDSSFQKEEKRVSDASTKSFEKSTGAGVTQAQKDRESAAFGALNKGGLMKKKKK
jgi:hypothetical protein